MQNRLSLVQILRFVAAFFVMLTHIRGTELLHDNGSSLLPSFVETAGFAGVDLFFVISGFVMSYVTTRLDPGASSAAKFMVARLARIYPTWWLFLGAYCALMFIIFRVPWHPSSLPDSVSGIEALLKSAFLIPQLPLPLLNVGWTLIHEQYFYLVFALLLVLPKAWRLPGLLIWALLPLAGIVFGLQSASASGVLELAVHSMTLEFIAGAVAGWLFTREIRPFPAILFGLGVVGFAVVALLSTPETLSNDRPMRVALLVLPCTFLVYGAAGLQDRFRNNKPLSEASILGDWSYTLYLCHPIVIIVTRRVFEDIPGTLSLGNSGLIDNVAFVTVCITVAVTVAALTHYLFEAPLIRWFRARLAARSKEKSASAAMTPPL
ncbi:MAG: hypothetical protein CMK09_06700 [Ponticaulis sp.]|nr:hypothetical protein [Ponticaulis sp.]|tara:strand:+ start:13606 stop:14739 length:1134 start_codon:yes stop_codon:yes gene_type:complete